MNGDEKPGDIASRVVQSCIDIRRTSLFPYSIAFDPRNLSSVFSTSVIDSQS